MPDHHLTAIDRLKFWWWGLDAADRVGIGFLVLLPTIFGAVILMDRLGVAIYIKVLSVFVTLAFPFIVRKPRA